VAADGQRHIVAFGGLPGPAPAAGSLRPYAGYLAGLTGRRQIRLAYLGTAQGDHPARLEQALGRFAEAGYPATPLTLFPMPSVADPEDFLLSQDVIFVGGGSVANLAAVWRVHGLDRIMRRAWESGVVLAGVSAGAICWFEGGTTDSFGPDLRPFTGGLGLLAGSFCPHYDSEPQRRPLFCSLIASGFLPPGVACEDGAGAHYIGADLAEVVTGSPGARGYRVEPDGAGGARHLPLAARLLAGAEEG
jgi:peptidase E